MSELDPAPIPPFPQSIGIRSRAELERALVSAVCAESTWEMLSLRSLTLRFGTVARKCGCELNAVLADLQARGELITYRLEAANKTYVFAPAYWKYINGEINAGKTDWERLGVWLKANVK